MNVTASETLGMNSIIQFLRHKEQLILFTKDQLSNAVRKHERCFESYNP